MTVERLQISQKVEEFVARLTGFCDKAEVVGEYRRLFEWVPQRIVILAICEDPITLFDSIGNWAVIVRQKHQVNHEGLTFQFRFTSQEEWATQLIRNTGTTKFWSELQALAQKRHLILKSEGLFISAERVTTLKEDDVFREIEIPYIPPEERTELPTLANERNYFRIESSDGSKYYTVQLEKSEWSCTCPHHIYRKAECKHIQQAMLQYSATALNRTEKAVDDGVNYEQDGD